MKQSLTMNVRALLMQSWAHGYSLATNQKGVAMIMALLAIAAIAMMGAFGAISAQSELQIAGNEQRSKRALGVSDAGVRHVLRILGDPANPLAYKNGFNDEFSNVGTGGVLGAAGAGLETIDGNQYVFFPFGGSGTDGYLVRVVDNFDELTVNNPADDRDQSILLVSRGRAGGAEKVIQALATPPVECALTFGLASSTVGGSAASNDVQVNSNEGAGACVHGNGPVTISGNTTFPDGATASGSMTCQGSGPLISGGTCAANAKGNEPLRNIIEANVGLMSQLVADLGNANANGPYYILHTRDSVLGAGLNLAGTVTRGGRCVQQDTAAPSVATPNTSQVGLCNGGVVVAMPAGVTIGGGTCTFDQNTPAGIYYCDGNVGNSGQIPNGGPQRAITFISRDHMSFSAQIDLRSFFNDANSEATSPQIVALANAANNIAAGAIPAPYAGDSTVLPLPSVSLSTIGTTAAGRVKNIFLVSGADLSLTGSNQNMVGIVLVHNEVNFSGSKTITGYVNAGDGLPTYTGDPHPQANIAENVPSNSVTGGLTVDFSNFSTLLPLGPPQLAAWNDDQR